MNYDMEPFNRLILLQTYTYCDNIVTYNMYNKACTLPCYYMRNLLRK